MDTQQITDALKRVFQEKNKRIIFWYDGEKEFEEIVPEIKLNGVNVLRIDEYSSLELKIRLEIDDPKGKYVLYAPVYEPPPEEDWLFDIRLYSHTFQADRASILYNELNLSNLSLMPFLKERGDFFKSQDRLTRLQKWVAPNDTQDDLDLKMIAVIAKSDQPEPFSILMKVFESFCRDGKYYPDEPSKPWQEIERLGLAGAFWKILRRVFGYVAKDVPTWHDFLLHVFATDFSNSLKCDLPDSISHFVLPNPTLCMNASVFLSQWRSHTGYFRHFNLVSNFIDKKLKINETLIHIDTAALVDVMTFESCERRIISSLRDQIAANPETGYDGIRQIIKIRLDGYWAHTILDEDAQHNLYKTAYHALENAICLFELRKKYNAGLSYPTASAMFTAYTEELFLFDQYYRKFHELSDKTDLGGWDVLKPLRESVENCYSSWFMTQLAASWGDFLEKNLAGNLLDTWKIPEIPNQYDFFTRYINPTLQESTRNRLFVVISDAFRFEAAQELTRFINGKYRLQAHIESMLGVVPGYTALGMASLLPHDALELKEGHGDVVIDGKPAASMEQRSAILARYDGLALKAEDLLSMSKEKGREFIKPLRIVYIYHDRIDATGDKAVSESKTFESVSQTIDELYSLVSFIINSLNGTRVIITGDHGFVYMDKPPEAIDKSTIETDVKNAIKTHKRFILGKNLPKAENTFSGNTKVTAHTDTDMEFLLPKGTNRFNFIGGARFFHGGSMLQEIVIPVVSVSEMKGIHLEKSEIRFVGVSLLGSYKKLVTNRPIYKFIQTEAVSDRLKPITLKVSLRDGNEPVSNEENITFDSSSESVDERQKSVKLSLKAGSYDNKKDYYLVLRNVDETEYDRMPVKIDIAFANDF